MVLLRSLLHCLMNPCMQLPLPCCRCFLAINLQAPRHSSFNPSGRLSVFLYTKRAPDLGDFIIARPAKGALERYWLGQVAAAVNDRHRLIVHWFEQDAMTTAWRKWAEQPITIPTSAVLLSGFPMQLDGCLAQNVTDLIDEVLEADAVARQKKL